MLIWLFIWNCKKSLFLQFRDDFYKIFVYDRLLDWSIWGRSRNDINGLKGQHKKECAMPILLPDIWHKVINFCVYIYIYKIFSKCILGCGGNSKRCNTQSYPVGYNKCSCSYTVMNFIKRGHCARYDLCKGALTGIFIIFRFAALHVTFTYIFIIYRLPDIVFLFHYGLDIRMVSAFLLTKLGSEKYT